MVSTWNFLENRTPGVSKLGATVRYGIRNPESGNQIIDIENDDRNNPANKYSWNFFGFQPQPTTVIVRKNMSSFKQPLAAPTPSHTSDPVVQKVDPLS